MPKLKTNAYRALVDPRDWTCRFISRAQGSETDFRKIWTYGESAYPPTKSDLSVAAQITQARKPNRPATRAPRAASHGNLERVGRYDEQA